MAFFDDSGKSALAPLASSGQDIEAYLASLGNGTGGNVLPWPVQGGPPAAAAPVPVVQSQLAAQAARPAPTVTPAAATVQPQPQAQPAPVSAANLPAPAGTAAAQPQGTGAAPDYRTSGFGLNFGDNLAKGGAQSDAGQGGNTYAITAAPNSLMDKVASHLASSGAQPAAPAATDSTGAPTVPASVTPSGDAQTGAVDENQAGIQRAGQMAEKYSTQLQGDPTLQATLAPIEEARMKASTPINPNDYKPSAGRRILRGLEGAGVGFSKRGIFGALGGAISPKSEGVSDYNDPTRQFGIAQTMQTGRVNALGQQEAEAEKVYTADTGRAKDVITSINDLGKNYAAGAQAGTKEELAKSQAERAQVYGQLADIKQEVADYQSNGKMPTTYEGTVAAAHLETDPVRRAALESAAQEMAATEIKKFQGSAPGAKPLTAAQQATAINEKNNALAKAKAVLDKAGYPPDPDDIAVAQEAYQAAQDSFEQKLGVSTDDPGHMVVGSDLAWHRSDGGAAAAGSSAKPSAKRAAPPKATAPAPKGAADMALGSDGQYHYRDAGKHDLGVVK